MKPQRNKGFTLIELLIVIAIIGILAAVLIPQLLEARTSANKRAVQVFSSTVYKVAVSIQAEDSKLALADIADAVQTLCQTNSSVSSISVNSSSYSYGWSGTPGTVLRVTPATDRCQVIPDTAGIDFIVSIKGDTNAGNVTSINGQQPN